VIGQRQFGHGLAFPVLSKNSKDFMIYFALATRASQLASSAARGYGPSAIAKLGRYPGKKELISLGLPLLAVLRKTARAAVGIFPPNRPRLA